MHRLGNPLEVKPLTGEPYARDPHVRFGGRGDRDNRSSLHLSQHSHVPRKPSMEHPNHQLSYVETPQISIPYGHHWETDFPVGLLRTEGSLRVQLKYGLDLGTMGSSLGSHSASVRIRLGESLRGKTNVLSNLGFRRGYHGIRYARTLHAGPRCDAHPLSGR